MTTTQIAEALRAHLTCRQTGIDCTVPHCLDCGGRGGPCDGDCEGTGQARCECGALAVQYVVHSQRGREAVCAVCPGDADYDEAVPVPADPGRTVRIPVETNAQLVWGSR